MSDSLVLLTSTDTQIVTTLRANETYQKLLAEYVAAVKLGFDGETDTDLSSKISDLNSKLLAIETDTRRNFESARNTSTGSNEPVDSSN